MFAGAGGGANTWRGGVKRPLPNSNAEPANLVDLSGYGYFARAETYGAGVRPASYPRAFKRSA
jgi:hypothetical protein